MFSAEPVWTIVEIRRALRNRVDECKGDVTPTDFGNKPEQPDRTTTALAVFSAHPRVRLPAIGPTLQ